MEKKERFERLKELESRIDKGTRFLERVDAYPHLTLSSKPAYKDGFWEVNEESKKHIGYTHRCDLPEDLGLRDMVINRVKKEVAKMQKEFNELMNL